MASTIAAVTTSGGGVVTTADASGNLNLLAGTTTVVALTTAGAAVSGTLGVTGVATLGNGAILGIPASGTVTNLTGTASININGTVGATTPAAGAFTSGTFSTTLGVTGTITTTAGNIDSVLAQNQASGFSATNSTNGTDARAYTLLISSAGNGGIAANSPLYSVFAGAGDSLTIFASGLSGGIQHIIDGGSSQLTVASAGVTIPGTLASGALTVTGAVTVNSGATASSLIANSTNAGGAALNIQNSGTVNALVGGWNAIIGSGNASDVVVAAVQAGSKLGLYVSGTTKIAELTSTGLAVTGTLSATGNVTGQGAQGFIAQPSGGTALRVYGSSNATPTAHQWDIYLNSTNLRISDNTSGGSVVIDTAATIASTLVVTAASNSLGVVINGRSSDNLGAMYFYANNGTTNYATITTSATEFRHSAIPAASVQTFYTNASERMRIDASGYFKAIANGGAAFTGGYHALVNNNNTSGAVTLVIGNNAGSATNNTSSHFLIAADTGGDRLYIFGNGNVVNLNNSYGALSDVKLKENIVDASPKLADLMQVKVRNYNLKTEPEHKQLGVIAQELETVFPAMVDESPDRDDNGNDLSTTTKSIKYSVFVPMLIKAIQEQQAIITALTTRITALEAK